MCCKRKIFSWLWSFGEPLPVRVPFVSFFKVSKTETNLSASHNAPVKSGGNEALPLQDQEQAVQRWSILWRSILLSCTEETLFPYCHYLRVLDLRDVYNLLDDDKFRGRIYQ